jgi:RNA polymerase sigma-B factor
MSGSTGHVNASTDARSRELIAAFRLAADENAQQDALDELVRIHMPLARGLARRYTNRGLEPDDLEQVAFLALLKAIHRFDLDKTTEFGAYATPTITGELRRHFRDHGWLVRPPRTLQERRQLVSEARARLEQELGHEPGAEELAQELDLTVEEVKEAQLAATNLRPVSLDAPVDPFDQQAATLHATLSDLADDPALDESIVVRHLVQQLPLPQQQLIELRYAADLTQAEIAQTMGLSPMQVSRQLRRTLDQLRSHLDEELAVVEETVKHPTGATVDRPA